RDAATFARRALRFINSQQLALGPFTSDGHALVVLGPDGVQLWSARTLQPQTRAFGVTNKGWAVVSPDGRTLAVGGSDAVQLFDLASEQPIGVPLPTQTNHGAAPVFSADGAYLFALTDAGVGYRWDVRPASWEARACAVAGRALSRAEWSARLPGRPYA